MASPTTRAVVLSLLASIFIGPLVGVGFAVLMATRGSDAWFGLQTSFVCEEVCEGCHGPLERRGGTNVVHGRGRGEPSKTYCQPPRGSLDDVKDLAPYEVTSRGETLLLAGSVVPVFALSWAVLFGVFRAVFRRRASAARG